MCSKCVVGDGRPAAWRGFCATCRQRLSPADREAIEKGRNGVSAETFRRRAIGRLHLQFTSIRSHGGGRPRT